MKTINPNLNKNELWAFYCDNWSNSKLIFLDINLAFEINKLKQEFDILRFGNTFKLFYTNVKNSKIIIK